LLYLTDARDLDKQARAAEWLDQLWREGNGSISWQVLHEFYVNAVGKLGVAPGEARFLAGTFLEWHPVDSSPQLLERAWHWLDEAHISYWDALIVAAAELSGCAVLLSEDFQAGRKFGGVEIVNPFAQPEPRRRGGERPRSRL
jgi:predicted nucleic acid-binding protein